MANKSINNLENAGSLANADLFVIWQNSTNTACNLTGQQFTAMLTAMADGHGGIASISWTTSGTSGDGQYHNATITYADGNTDTFSIRDGVKGNTGAQTYVWIKYADSEPTADADMGDVPAAWMGIYVGVASSAPSAYTSYTWYQIKGAKGDTGDSIDQIRLTEQSGLVDTYTVTTVSGVNVGTFTVTNGNGGVSTVNSIAPDGNGNVAAVVSSVSELSLTVGSATVADAYSALLANQMLVCPATDFANAQLPYVDSTYITDGTVEIYKGNGTNGWIEFHGRIDTVGDFRMYLNSSSVPSGTWIPLIPTTFTGSAKALTIGWNQSTGAFYIRATESSTSAIQLNATNSNLRLERLSGTTWNTVWTK